MPLNSGEGAHSLSELIHQGGLVMQFVHSARAYLGQRLRPRREVAVETAADLIELAHWIERPPLRLLVPVSLLRMQGGFVYGPGHPFVAALQKGPAVLDAFYAQITPRTIAAYYGMAGDTRRGADLPPWEVPWYGRKARHPPPGERGLGPDHGVSFYGPVTQQKRALEMERLNRTMAVIAKNGFAPDAYGDIEGYVLRHGDDACFFVRGGKHRTAVLTALGHDHIPVAFRATFPRMVDSAQAEYWPLVRAGRMEMNLARDILAFYMQGR
jgi:hypothetical protein